MKDEIKPPQTKYRAKDLIILATFEIMHFACIAEDPRKTGGRLRKTPAEEIHMNIHASCSCRFIL